MIVEDGSLVVRSEYAAGADVPATPVGLPPNPGRIFTIRLPGLPSLAGIVVKEGDHVEVGQPVARYIDDAALESADADVTAATRALEAAQRDLTSAQLRADLERARFAEAVARAKEELARTTQLVDGGAEPEHALVRTEAKLREAETAELDNLTRTTSELRRLEEGVEVALEAVRQASEGARLRLEGQWVRSPVEGRVVALQYGGSERESLDVQVVLLASQ